MAPFATLFRVELVKTVRRPMTWILAVVFLGFVALIYGSLIVALLGPEMQGFDRDQLREQMTLPEGVGFGVDLAADIATILLIVLAAGSFGSEFSWGTIRTMLLMRAGRGQLLAAKLVVLALVAVILALASVAVGIVGSLAVGLLIDGPVAPADWLSAGFVGDVALIALRTVVALGMWGLIAATLAVVTHSLAVGLGIAMAFYFVGTLLVTLVATVGRIGEYIARFFPNHAIGALMALNQANPPDYAATDYLWITANLAGYATLLAVVMVLSFRRMNVIAASS